MGHGLQRLMRAHRGKLPVVTPEGMTKPVIPIVPAKFATECNIAIRNHISMFKHWKEYKNQPTFFESTTCYLFVARIHVSTFSSSEMQIFNLSCYSLTGNMFFHLNRLSLI
jgi:hypothetical protein